jgi:hypothetical protein
LPSWETSQYPDKAAIRDRCVDCGGGGGDYGDDDDNNNDNNDNYNDNNNNNISIATN